jgi:hypothetical protein
MPSVDKGPWERRAKALEALARADRRREPLSPEDTIAWIDDALRLARERGFLREEDPRDPAVLRRRRRVREVLARARA